MQQRTASKPIDIPGSHHDFDICTAFVQQGGRLNGALAAAHDNHPAACEATEVAMIRCMRGKG